MARKTYMHLDMVVDALVALHVRSVDSGWCLTCIDMPICRLALNHCSIPTIYWQNLHVHCKTDSLRKILINNAAVTVLSIQHSKLHVHFSTSTKRWGLTHHEQLSRQLHRNGVKIQFTFNAICFTRDESVDTTCPPVTCSTFCWWGWVWGLPVPQGWGHQCLCRLPTALVSEAQSGTISHHTVLSQPAATQVNQPMNINCIVIVTFWCSIQMYRCSSSQDCHA